MSKGFEDFVNRLRKGGKYNRPEEGPYIDPKKNEPFVEMEDEGAPRPAPAEPSGDKEKGLESFMGRLKKKKMAGRRPEPEDIFDFPDT